MKLDPIFLLAGDTAVYWYGITIALAVAAGIGMACFARKIQKKNINHVLLASLLAMPLALLGGRMYFAQFGASNFTSAQQAESLAYGGFGLYGAMIGAVAAVIITAFFLKCSVGELLDAMAPGFAAVIAIGRWGSVFSGENMGSIVSNESMQTLPLAVFSSDEGVWRTALFFYESLVAAVICAVVTGLINNAKKNNRFHHTNGDAFLLFVICYSLIQGLFEEKRCDPLFFINNYVAKLQTVRVSFALGALFAAIALAILLLRRMIREGIKLSNIAFCIACAALYVGYFSEVLRISTDSTAVNTAIVAISAAGLIGVGVLNYIALSTKIPPRKKKSRRNTY